MTNRKKKVTQIAIVLMLVCTAFISDWVAHRRSATERQQLLQDELRQIGRPAGATQISLNSNFKTTAGVLDEQNRWPGDPQEIPRWYSGKLSELGWAQRGTDVRGNDGVVRFCRNAETLSLTVPLRPDNSPLGMDYRVQLGWGGPWKC